MQRGVMLAINATLNSFTSRLLQLSPLSYFFLELLQLHSITSYSVDAQSSYSQAFNPLIPSRNLALHPAAPSQIRSDRHLTNLSAWLASSYARWAAHRVSQRHLLASSASQVFHPSSPQATRACQMLPTQRLNPPNISQEMRL